MSLWKSTPHTDSTTHEPHDPPRVDSQLLSAYLSLYYYYYFYSYV
jgi:hypothetical protein